MSEYTLGGCVYTVRRETIKDALKADSVARLFPPDYSWELARAFVRYSILTSTGGQPVLGRAIELFTGKELYAAADAWGESDADAVYLFYDAVAREKEASNAAHLKPGVIVGNSPAPTLPSE